MTLSANEVERQYQAFRDGDQAAAGALIECLEPHLRRFVASRPAVDPRIDPEDILQEALLIFARRLEGFPADLRESGLRSYLFQIAKWRLADALADLTEGGDLSPNDIAMSEPSAGPVTRADDRNWTREQIESLPPRYREPLKLYYVEGRSVAAIAIELDVAANLVKQQLARGRKLLIEIVGTEDRG